MFLENDYARPLFDFEKGGKAKAFECLMPDIHWNKDHCGKVTRTERGMRLHLKIVHNWKEQPCLYSTESQSEPKESGLPRKLRAGPPVFQRPEEKPAPEDMEKIPASQKLVETNVSESPKPTREEK